MKQSGHLNPSKETGTGCPVNSKYGRTPPNKHGGVGSQPQSVIVPALAIVVETMLGTNAAEQVKKVPLSNDTI